MSLLATIVLALCLILAPMARPATAARAQGSTFVFFEKFPPDNPQQWNVQSLSDGSRTYISGGAYHIIRAKPGTMRGWPLHVKVPTGFQFNVRMQLVKGTDPYEGVTFWDDLGNNFELFAITPDGKAGLFKHGARGYTILVNWQAKRSIHVGVGAVNSLSVNMDPVSVAQGRTLLINGVPLGKPCADSWHKAMGTMPTPPAHGLFVGVVAGAYKGSTHVEVQRASMYDGTNAGPVPNCP
jgi:hypothetical protein